MLAGYHNAVTAPADRTGAMSRRDEEWTDWMRENEMQVADRADTDPSTHSYRAGNDAATSGRIDDWITASENRATLTDTKVDNIYEHGSAHQPVTTMVTGWAVGNVDSTTPDWSRQTMERINLPKAEDKEKTTQEILDHTAAEIETLSKLVVTEDTLTDEGLAEAEILVSKITQQGMPVVRDMWGLQTQAEQGEQETGKTPWLPRAKQTTYKQYMTTAKKLRALTTYVKRRYSGDTYNVEDHSAIEHDATVERMTNELGCDMRNARWTG